MYVCVCVCVCRRECFVEGGVGWGEWSSGRVGNVRGLEFAVARAVSGSQNMMRREIGLVYSVSDFRLNRPRWKPLIVAI